MKKKIIKKISKNIYEVQNVFPKNVAEKIYLKFHKHNSKSWKLVDQKKPGHYGHVFKNNSKFLPDKNETYLAKFYRSDKLKNNPYIIDSIKKFVFPLIKKNLRFNIKEYDIRCHKFIKDNLARLHFDNYAGKYAITLNFNKIWKWDWGGLLSVPISKNSEKLFSMLPKWNSLSIIYSGQNNSPHFVTAVQKFAKSSRYSITIFIK
jgi:Rps23 Pro-64 3,4-dihydroxylase Tpa1-like proline 4-hydroxylase